MNRYGTIARDHWQQHLPMAFRQIPDPEEFFTRLGEQMQLEVTALSRSMAGDDPGGETFLQKLGRLNMAELRAQEMVLREMLPEAELDAMSTGPTG
jgi:hypothetical protein